MLGKATESYLKNYIIKLPSQYAKYKPASRSFNLGPKVPLLILYKAPFMQVYIVHIDL